MLRASACAAVFMAIMTGPLSAQKARPIEVTDELRQAVENAIKGQLDRPETATFGEMAAGRAPLFVIVCGWIDYDRGDRDYTGNTPFLARYLPLDGQVAVAGIGPQVTGQCQNAGLTLP